MTDTCRRFLLSITLCIIAAGCSHSPKISHWESVAGLPKKLAVYPGVFWTKGTQNFRTLIRQEDIFKDKTVYEIGTGTGILALLALQAGSKYAVATDIDPDAVRNAKFNAQHFGVEDRMDVRLVSEASPGAYSVLKENERFDFIISNPPWTGKKPRDLKERQTTDEDFMLIKSIIRDLNHHLNPGGSALLSIGDTNTIKLMENLAAGNNLKMEVVDEKTNDGLRHPSRDGFFFPSAIIKITPLESKASNGMM